MTDPKPLTVAVTGPTGTLGFGLVPLLQADDRVGRIVGVARRPFDPAAHGWTKMDYRQGNVRDPASLAAAFRGADVVVHLAFLITGTAGPAVTRAVNVEGTLNTVRAAAGAGASRLVYASSVAAYGFHPDNPVGMTEDWPVRPADRLFYARDKAELEHLLADEVAAHPGLDLYLLRPSIVLGPHTMGAKDLLPGPLTPISHWLARLVERAPAPLPVAVPAVPVQFVHEEDVGRAIVQCVVAAGPPGAYNIAADGVLTATDVAREVGLRPVWAPRRLAQRAARVVARLPAMPFVPATAWAEALSHPAIMDTTKARQQLGWRPRYTALETLRATLHPDAGATGDGGAPADVNDDAR